MRNSPKTIDSIRGKKFEVKDLNVLIVDVDLIEKIRLRQNILLIDVIVEVVIQAGAE